jgi:hypothetical protein
MEQGLFRVGHTQLSIGYLLGYSVKGIHSINLEGAFDTIGTLVMTGDGN